MPIKKKAMMIKIMSTPKKSEGQGFGGHTEDEDKDDDDDEQLPLHITIETWLTSAGFPDALVGETKSVSFLVVLGY